MRVSLYTGRHFKPAEVERVSEHPRCPRTRETRLLNASRRDVRHPNLSLRSRFCPRFALAFDRLLRADRLCHGIKERKASIVFQVAQDPDGQSQKEIKRNGAVRELKCGLYAREQQSQNKV